MPTPAPQSNAVARWITGHSVVFRYILAGPLALLAAILSMAGLPLVLPGGAAGINNLVLPVVMFPLLLTGFILWPVATQNVPACLLGMLAIILALVATIASSFLL